MNKLIKIGAALSLAAALIVGGITVFGQAQQTLPNFTQGTSVQPTINTNVQIATVAVIGGGVVLAPGQTTNVATGLTVGDSNAIPTVSNPFGSMNTTGSGAAGVFTNTLLTSGVISNLQAFIAITNPGTNSVRLTNAFVKIKLESWQ